MTQDDTANSATNNNDDEDRHSRCISQEPSNARSSKPFTSRDKRKTANRARHRLLSIQHDVETYLKPLLSKSPLLQQQDLPVIANERAGTWYALPFNLTASCHFKSTDGHVHLFSLKRLNLPLIKILSEKEAAKGSAAVILMDASNKKEMPDSFSRTIPIWCAVLNRTVERYRRDLGLEPLFREIDLALHIPTWIIPKPEQAIMYDVIDTRVEELYQSQAIVDVPGLVSMLTKPLRPFWITPHHSAVLSEMDAWSDNCFRIICCNASNICLDCSTAAASPNNNNKNNNNSGRIVWVEESQFWYTPGAADDHESWARQLTPQLFWKHVHRFSPSLSEQETDALIDSIVQQERAADDIESSKLVEDNNNLNQSFDWIGDLHMAIGTRRAGRPPVCWNHFDAILNVTSTEYDDIHATCQLFAGDKFYLQLPVEEGKRDRQELERWMAVGIFFCAFHALEDRRVLVHCAQGKDRSVAIVMATVQIFCTLHFPLKWNQEILQRIVNQGTMGKQQAGDNDDDDDDAMYQSSGLPERIVTNLLGREGRDWLLRVIREARGISAGESIATKESLRVVLHLIRQDREPAEPTRSTMQKLNRFFMSEGYTPKTATLLSSSSRED